MKLGMIGLGKMGGNMAERLRRRGHEVVGMDPGKPDADASIAIGHAVGVGGDGQIFAQHIGDDGR